MSEHDTRFIKARIAFHDGGDAASCAYWDTNRADYHEGEAIKALHAAAAALGFRIERVANHALPDGLDALASLLEVHDAMGAGNSHAASKARAILAKAENPHAQQ